MCLSSCIKTLYLYPNHMKTKKQTPQNHVFRPKLPLHFKHYPLSINFSSYHNIVEAYVKWWITYFKNESAFFWGGGYCGWGCTHNNMLNMLITIDQDRWLWLQMHTSVFLECNSWAVNSYLEQMRMTGSKHDAQLSCGEPWVEMHFNGVRENSSQKLSPSIYHNPICVNLKDTDFIRLLTIKMGPFG